MSEGIMNRNSIMLLKSACHYLLQALEVINLIPEEDYRTIILKGQTKKQYIKNICDNAQRSSPFLLVFFVLELFSELSDEIADEQK
jgi:hypothetical protein